jgi:hypothetical protein
VGSEAAEQSRRSILVQDVEIQRTIAAASAAMHPEATADAEPAGRPDLPDLK